MLSFLVGLFLVVGFLGLLVTSAAFRKGVGVLALLAFLAWQWLENDRRQSDAQYRRQQEAERMEQVKIARERDARSRRIKVTDVEFRDAVLAGAPRYPADTTLTATVSNHSEVDLASLDILLRLYECAGPAAKDFANCEVIGEATRRVPATVPAGQARQMRGDFPFPNTPTPKRGFAWTFEVKAITAE